MGKLKSLFLVFLIALVLPTTAKEYKYKTVPGDLTKTRIYKLDNGLTVYLSVNDNEPRIQTYIAVRTGSRNDPPETTGLAHYFEHLMFKGTRLFGTTDAAAEAPLLDSIQNRFEVYRTLKDSVQRREYYHGIDSLSQLAAKYFIPNEYDKLMAAIGAKGTNAFTGYDMTCFVEDIPSNEVENWARIEADRFQNMVIRGFHTELEAVYEEYNIGLTNDFEKAYNALNYKLYPGHPYGTQTIIGTQEHLKNPSILNLKKYFKRYYVPNNVAICMSGDFNPDEVIAVIDKYFGSWKPNPHLSQPEYAPLKELTATTDTTVVGNDAERVLVGWRFDKASSMQADTLKLVSEMLDNNIAGLFNLDLNQSMKCMSASALTEWKTEYSSIILNGRPKKNQTLDEVKELMLSEIDKLKRGDFDENLIKAVANNEKLKFYQSIESNKDRADMMATAFINRAKWGDVIGRIDRISGITKQQVIDFARRHFLDNYVTVYKRIGTDTTQKKIDKPQITPIPANRDLQSDFVKEIINSKVEPIHPKFVDFKKDIVKGKTKKSKLPVLYVKNTENGRFKLTYYIMQGQENDKWLKYAANYMKLLGTDKMTAKRLQQKFYELACSYKIDVRARDMYVSISGLAKNMPEAISLFDDFIENAKVDTAAYSKFVEKEEDLRSFLKLSQDVNCAYLQVYGMYGTYNGALFIPSSEELHSMNPQQLIDKIRGLKNYKHTIMYYGPMELDKLISILDKNHKTPKKLADTLMAKHFTMQPTPQNEVLIAPYDAKNIYMVQYHNDGHKWSPEREPVISLFNEYYGGGMNSVVFQELRESRGLAYSAYAEYGSPAYKELPEYASTIVISQNDKMMDCIRTFNSILDTIPRSEKALELSKQAIIKRIASERTTRENIFDAYIDACDHGIDYDINKKIYDTVPSLTMDDIVKFEQETMANKPYRYMILGDEKQLDMKALEKIGPIKRLTTEDIFGY